MKNILLAAITIFAFTKTANAYWDVQNSGEDVFGNVNVTASSIGDNGNRIRFECGSSDEPFFVFLVRDNSESFNPIPARFIHIDQNKDRHTVDASLIPWNKTYAAIKVSDRSALRRVAEHMTVAKKSISVGIIIPNSDYKVADTFSSRGSTNAGSVVLKHCLPE